MLVELSPKECALIYKAIEHVDFSYIGESKTAEAVQKKVERGAIEYSQSLSSPIDRRPNI